MKAPPPPITNMIGPIAARADVAIVMSSSVVRRRLQPRRNIAANTPMSIATSALPTPRSTSRARPSGSA